MAAEQAEPFAPSIPVIAPGSAGLAAAQAYAAAGLFVGPLRHGTKHPGSLLGGSWNTQTTNDPNAVAPWYAYEDHGVFIHVGRSGLVVFDVDNPEHLPDVLKYAIAETHPPFQSTNPSVPGRGHYLFRCPPGKTYSNSTAGLPGGWGDVRGTNGVIVVSPTRHAAAAEGRAYVWLQTGAIPLLPDYLDAVLTDGGDRAQAAYSAEVTQFLATHQTHARPASLDFLVNEFRDKVAAGHSRHESCQAALVDACRRAKDGLISADLACEALAGELYAVAGTERDTTAEFGGMLAWAVGQVRDYIPILPWERDATVYEESRAAGHNVVPGPWLPQGPQPGSYDVQAAQLPAQRPPVQDRLAELRSKLLDAEGLRHLPPPDPLAQGWLFRNTMAWLVGEPGKGKSFVAVDLACSVATGTPWFGAPVRRGKVVYVIAEGASGLGQRVTAWEQYHNVAATDVLFLPVAVRLYGADGHYPADLDALVCLLAEIKPELVILDTQARVTVGAEENSAREMGIVHATFDALREASGGTVLVVHHTARGQSNPRGSSATEGVADTIVKVAKEGAEVTLTNEKQKDAPEHVPLTLVLAPVASSVVLTFAVTGGPGHRLTESETRVLDCVRVLGPVTASKIQESTELSKASVYRAIATLMPSKQDPSRQAEDRIQVLDPTSSIVRYRIAQEHPDNGPGGYRPPAGPTPPTAPQNPAPGPENTPEPPVDKPVDNPTSEVSLLNETGVSETSHRLSESQAVSEEKVPSDLGSLNESQAVSEDRSSQSQSHPPYRGGRLGRDTETEGTKTALVEQSNTPPALPAAAPLPDMPEPPRKLTKAEQNKIAREQAAAQKLIEAAGPQVQLPALVTRDQTVVPLELGAADELLATITSAGQELTVDVEHTGYAIGDQDYELRTAQLGRPEFAVVLDVDDPAQREVIARHLETAPALAAHSATADLVPLAHAGLVDWDAAWAKMTDTAIAYKLTDPRAAVNDSAAGLKQLSATVLGRDGVAKDADRARAELFKAGKWLTDTEPTTPVERSGWYQVDKACATQVRYAASDVLDTAELARRAPQLPEHLLIRERTVEMMTARVTYTGFKLDGEHVDRLRASHLTSKDEIQHRIRTEFGIDNAGSGQQIASKLTELGLQLPRTDPSAKHPSGQPSVAKGALEPLRGAEGPAGVLVDLVLQYRHHSTALSLFLEAFHRAVTRGDGRVRSTIYTLGTDTGRMSSTRFNMQQLSRQGGIRACVVADDGYKLISADFASVEIRVAAALSGDIVLVQMLAEGAQAQGLVDAGLMTKREWQERYDPHAMAAVLVFGKDWTKEHRYMVKRGVFGRIYGGGVTTLAKQMGVSEAIAQRLIDAIDTLWPQLAQWSRNVAAMAQAGQTQWAAYNGRVIHFPPDRAYAAPNYCIQGTARELLVDALMRWHGTEWGHCTLLPVHDELVVMVPETDAERATAELVRCMEGELNGVRIVAEASEPASAWQDAA